METPLNASSTTAGSLLSGGRFHVPPFQREYAWGKDEVQEFFSDLSKSLSDDTYFLGLVIITGKDGKEPLKSIVDGQQRLLTLTLLTSALYHQARKYDRNALADRIRTTFLRSIDFGSDEELPRLVLSSNSDNETLKEILKHPASELEELDGGDDTISGHLLAAYRLVSERLIADINDDPFKRLGMWADFLTNRLYFAVFVHPNPSSAYRVFEVINTRGKELTTADLLKSYVLSYASSDDQERWYREWSEMAGSFSDENANAFVNFIRHAITPLKGYVPPRDLYDVLTGRGGSGRPAMGAEDLMHLLERSLPSYLQTMDPTVAGPADQDQLAVFSVLNELNVVSARPILLAMLNTPNGAEGMRTLLKLIVRRAVVGSLGSGSIERRFGQAAQRIHAEGSWESSIDGLSDLNPGIDEFRNRLHTRSMNKNLLSIVRSSVLQNTITPEPDGSLYFIKPRGADWSAEDDDRVSFWVTTIGNSFLATEARRPMGSSSWSGFKQLLLPKAVDGECVDRLARYDNWDLAAIEMIGGELATAATEIWYA